MTDQWKHVWGFSRYLISREGVVKSRETGLFVLQEPGRDGCMTVTLMANSGTRFVKKVCRLVVDSFDWTDGSYTPIYHIDGNKRNNRLNNLRRIVEVDTDIARRKAESTVVFEPPEKPKRIDPPVATRKKVAKPRKREKQMKDHRAVRVVETGQEFKSVYYMCQILGLDPSTVSKMLRGVGRNLTHHGYTFEYVTTTKKVGIRVVETGEEFASLTEIANKYHVDPSNVSKLLRGNSVSNHAKGLTFEYVTEEVPNVTRVSTSKYQQKAVRIVETGEEFPSQSALAKHWGVSRGNISELVSSGTKTIHGYHVEFVKKILS